ncbi:MAG: hypothetical protein ACREIS_05665 [Nitrospiraceae bacterium]
MSLADWNPRYLAYGRDEHPGLGPDAILDADDERWPGGCMTGFMIWIGRRWTEWLKAHPEADPHILTDENHAAFDEWLAKRDAPSGSEGASPCPKTQR